MSIEYKERAGFIFARGPAPFHRETGGFFRPIFGCFLPEILDFPKAVIYSHKLLKEKVPLSFMEME